MVPRRNPGSEQCLCTAITPAKLGGNFKYCLIRQLLSAYPVLLRSMNDRGCLLLIPHEPEASDRDAQPQGDELFCNSGCLLMDFQKPLRAAEVWALRKQASLPGPVSTLCLSRRFSRGCLCHWGSAALCSGTSKCNRARFGGPASPLLVQECGCAALLLLPCSYAV